MKSKDSENATKAMSVISVFGRKHVIMPPLSNKSEGDFKDPNYLSTKNALVGILKIGETLDQFKKRWLKLKKGEKYGKKN